MMNIQYITDDKGRHKAVVTPIKEWEEMKKEHALLKYKFEVLNGIEDALQEVSEIKEGKRKKGRTLSEFLDEA